MCDYSLYGIASRPARVGDRLVSTSFAGSFTRGFTSKDEPAVAVCLRPGTELAFDEEVEFEHAFRRLLPRFRFGSTGERVARFTQVQMDRPDTHHDALEFPNGKVVLVTRLCLGQRATVLQLPAGAQPGRKPQAQAERNADATAERNEQTPLSA